VTGLVGLGVTAGAIDYKAGDIIEFGSYPQSEVKVSATISALNAQADDWQSYGYYSGTGDTTDGKMKASDYMQFCDVMYNGQQYRGVQFTQYRPHKTGLTCSESNSFQSNNGYTLGTTYWFLYEPLLWRVLDPTTGLVLCESIIDSQAFHNFKMDSKNDSGFDVYYKHAWYGDAEKTYYSNNYEHSSIRDWLNDVFLNTAFSAAQKTVVVASTLDNSAYSLSYSAYGCSPTTDKVFLLSYKDVLNTAYGFKTDHSAKDSARQAKGTDYAKCQGLYSNDWWLRSAGNYSLNACMVSIDGSITESENSDETLTGVRPALSLNLQSLAMADTQLNVPKSATVGYKATVTVNVITTNLQSACKVALYEGNTQLAKGDNTTVTYKMDKMTASRTLTAKIIDLNGNVQSNADGKLEKEIKITVKTGFFDKVKAFFLGLFGLLPKVELKP
jgi:hypothetical protein